MPKRLSLALLLGSFGAILAAQGFDVAVIKPVSAGDERFFYRMAPGGTLTANGVTVHLLMFQAFGLPIEQITGGPAWLGSDRWNIEAKAEGIEGRVPRDRERAMLEALLKDRFALKYHRGKQQRPIYSLLQATGGAKLAPSKAERMNQRVGLAEITLERTPVGRLAELLADRVSRPVLDKTNLTGDYDMKLEWMPDFSRETMGLPGLKPPPGAPALPDNGKPNLFTALQEQLGLRLAAGAAEVEVVVIDSIERPSEN